MELTAKKYLKKIGFNHIEIYTAQKAYHIDGLAKIMEDYHEAKVKNLGLFDVRQQRELVINFMTFYDGDENSVLPDDIVGIIDLYFKN